MPALREFNVAFSDCPPAEVARMRAEIAELVDLRQSPMGYSPRYMVPDCDDGVMEFFAADNTMLAEVGMLGKSSLRCYQTWSLMPAFFDTGEAAAKLRSWLVARGLTFRD